MIDNTGLPDDIALWRYMDFNELLYIILTKGLYLLRPDQFGDPLECFCPGIEYEDYRKIVRSANVLCWHLNDTESEAMWNLYSRDVKGAIAIKTTKAVLKDLFDDSYSIEAIRYIDYVRDKPVATKAYLYKRLSFKHEQEIYNGTVRLNS